MTGRGSGSDGRQRRVYRFDRFGLSEMVLAAADLRAVAERADGFEAAARALVERLRSGFVDAAGEPALPLIRLYSTRRFEELPQPLRAKVRGRPGEWFLLREAAAGGAAEPNGRPPVMPLGSPRAVAELPMISALVRELERPGTGDDEPFGVFHVPVAAGSDRVPNQDLIAEHGIRSVLGFGGVLPGGDVFGIVMFSAVPIHAAAAERFRAVAVSVRAALAGKARAAGPDGNGGLRAQRDALREHLGLLEDVVGSQAAELERAVTQLRAEADLVDLLQAVGRRLMSQLDMDSLVQDATEVATRATGAAFGAFFYNVVNERGESYMLYTLAGVPREAFAKFPMPRNTDVFAATFSGAGVVRSDDITADPRYGHNEPHRGMPSGHLPVCSYLAVPVLSSTSREVLGGFFFGHPEPARFTARHEQLAEGIAGYAAIALDNARLYNLQRGMATELQRSMLPALPPVSGFRIVSRYLPAATGSEVGGDWFDVVDLPAGRTAFVVGDVMGRGVPAAAVMGQVRTAVRSYAALDPPPSELMRHVSDLAETMPGQQFITCVYAVHDAVAGTLTYANAGHPPPALVGPDGEVTFLRDRLGLPLRVGREFLERRIDFPAGSGLVLYTDGLVERRDRPLETGIADLAGAVRRLAARPDAEVDAACDGLIVEVTGGAYDDDVALLYARELDRERRSASIPLDGRAPAGPATRRFVRRTLADWGLEEVADRAATVATELVSNAVRHAEQPIRLRLHRSGDRLVLTVVDRDQRLPRRMSPALEDEEHRGLVIVDAYAARWGSRQVADGKVVWAEIDLPG